MKLESLRKRIDNVDRKIMQLVARRLTLARKAGRLKKKKNLPVIDKNREVKVLLSMHSYAKQLDIPDMLAIKIIRLLISFSKGVQKDVYD